MLRFFETLRRKPLAARRRAALLITVSVTALIFVLWLVTFPASLPERTAGEDAAAGPFSAIVKRFSVFSSSIAGEFSVVRRMFSTSTPER